MFVKDWMSSPVITVEETETLPKIIELMKVNDIRHLPVVKGKRMAGIISDRDIKEYLPSNSTTLDVFELHYLIGKVKAKQVMKKNVISAEPYLAIEEAALLLYKNKISSLPVLENDEPVGILTDADVYKILMELTGVEAGGHRIYLELEDKSGSIREAADIVRSYGYGIESILSSHILTVDGRRKVVLRTRGSGDFDKMKSDITGKYPDCFVS